MESTASTLDTLQASLRAHPVYSSVRTVEDVRFFMERHVVCVWDFMSLLKSLQRELTCVDVPRRPAGDPEAARLVNEIVLAEESDVLVVDGTPRTASHFEWYLDAMGEVGCDTGPIRSLLRGIGSRANLQAALERSGLPEESIDSARTTFELLERPLHVRAAVFQYGREDVIPQMFLPLAQALERGGLPCRLFVAYLERHVLLDGEAHGPQSRALLERLCAGDGERRRQGEQAAVEALLAASASGTRLRTEFPRAGP